MLCSVALSLKMNKGREIVRFGGGGGVIRYES